MRTLFSGGTLYTGHTEAPAPGDILVEDGRITAVGSGLDADEVIDCTGRWISPGFFDAHVHVAFDSPSMTSNLESPFSLQFYRAAANLKRTLDIGVTSVRDAAGADLGIKTAVDTGLIPGPRMQISISLLSQTGGHGDSHTACGVDVPLMVPHPGRPRGVVDGVDEVRRMVRTLIREGADVIKVATTGGVLSPRDDPRHAHFRDAEIAVMVEEAAAAGLAVMAHAQGTEGVKAAIRNGVRSIEHGIFLDDEAIEMMLDRGTWLVPTLHAPRSLLAAIDAGVPYPPAVVDKAHMVFEAHRDSVRRAHEAGVAIAMGTDCGVGPHGTNLDELAFMTECGMSDLDALHATTGSAAALLGVADDRGLIAPGQRADLVVLDGTPGEVTDLTPRVRGVYQDGRLVSDGPQPAA
ncbi:amidohydrolase family protein [Williamsia sp. CHRR-6]|uniref:metal-dependent hydrolase family protein n=1 Tax=Williamsia sp. CHRR-6 TaxID=2835871 RepID=UPI001BDAFB86|nr:amidohydrolase family protein [Williamsia sp. CHRR-6]MBT0566491.1 amidohydrolase family protein [Williamsia sp. CHRR-6]